MRKTAICAIIGSPAEMDDLRSAVQNMGVVADAMFVDRRTRSHDRPKLRGLSQAVARGEIAQIVARRIEDLGDVPHRAVARLVAFRRCGVEVSFTDDTWVAQAGSVLPHVTALLLKEARRAKSVRVRAALARARARTLLGRPRRAVPVSVLRDAGAMLGTAPFEKIARMFGVPSTSLRRALRRSGCLPSSRAVALVG